MSRVYETTDLICLQIDDIKVWVSPLDLNDKMELMGLMYVAAKDPSKSLEWIARCIKYSVKKIEGLTHYKNGKAAGGYTLEFESEDKRRLTDKCVTTLMNIKENPKLAVVCTSLIEGIPEGNWVHPLTKRTIDGISFVEEGGDPLEQSPQSQA